jgi:hypothetical protein
MSTEDIVQIQDIKQINYKVLGSPLALSVLYQAGFGTYTRLGVGSFNLSTVAGANPSFNLNRIAVRFVSKQGTGVFGVAAIDITNSTATNLRIKTLDAAGNDVDVDGTMIISQCENFQKGG